jgi:S1-C subfamily serine protease
MEVGSSHSGSDKRAAREGSAARACWIVAFAVAALLALWASRSCTGGSANSTSFRNAVQSLATNPTEFVKSRITGGVGALLARDPAGLPQIDKVMAGSPADKAGLRAGDVITHVNGETMTGKNLNAVVDAIRGFSMGSVTITVLRGQTNRTRMEFVVRRQSMSTLLQPTNSAIP